MFRVSSIFLALILCLCLGVIRPTNAKSFPIWPDNVSYHVEIKFLDWIISMPIDVTIMKDSNGRSSYYSFYDGLNMYYSLKNNTFLVYPKIDRMVCDYQDRELMAVNYLPPADQNWVYIGEKDGIDYWSATHNSSKYSNTIIFKCNASNNAPISLQSDAGYPDPSPFFYPVVATFSNYKIQELFIPPLPSICNGHSGAKRSAFPHITFLLKGLDGMLKGRFYDPSEIHHHEFSSFMLKHSKSYSDEEEYNRRFEIFKQNLEKVKEHNKRQDVSYSLGVTKFSDLTEEEFRALYLNKRYNDAQKVRKSLLGRKEVEIHKPGSDPIPPTVDWTKKEGVVNPIKDQGACGSCWAFGSISALESAWAIKTGRLYSLSEQQIIDCVWTLSSGCDGGLAEDAYDWISSHGISAESSQPYLMLDGRCKYNYSTDIRVEKYVAVANNTHDIMDALANHGPLAAAMDASDPNFILYSDGVYVHQESGMCGADTLDHEVVIVGYGTDTTANGDVLPYWLVRNSWGPYWGMKGYFKLLRSTGDGNSACCINLNVLYPVV